MTAKQISKLKQLSREVDDKMIHLAEIKRKNRKEEEALERALSFSSIQLSSLISMITMEDEP
jgi:hypothetical protein